MRVAYLHRLISNSALLFLIVFVAIGCGSARIGNQSNEMNRGQSDSYAGDPPREIEGVLSYPIIEVWQELDGSVPIRGKSLYLRMYDDGAVEFDYLMRKSNGAEQRAITYSTERTPRTKISEEAFGRMKSLSGDLLKNKDLKQEFSPVGLSLDTTAKLTFVLKDSEAAERRIVINDSDSDVMNSKFESVFPKSLIDLVKEIDSTRRKLAPEQHLMR